MRTVYFLVLTLEVTQGRLNRPESAAVVTRPIRSAQFQRAQKASEPPVTLNIA